MEWDAPAIVLDVRPYGEADAIVTLMTREHGLHRGLARGGTARSQTALWQPGNLAQVRWVARTADQLGAFSGEMVHATAALVLDDALALSMLTAVCATAEDALPEREPHPAVFAGLLHLLPRLTLGSAMLPDLVRWETVLLGELGYGLDLTTCAITGGTTDLAFVSPKTGRAVARDAARDWIARLLPLPAFLHTDAPASPIDWRDGLRLTGHFLARDVFGLRHRPLPRARQMLYDRVSDLANESESPDAG
jgi:DNA repair protein RecO (recombination protein O)